MNKKINFIILFVTFLVSFVFSNVSANELEIGDFYAKSEAYSFSEDSNEIYMPFMRFCSDSVKVDKKINNIGAIFANKTIEVNAEITKPVALFSQDTIRINEIISDAAIFSTSNIIVEKGTNGTIILFAMGDVTISENAVIEGDLICYATNLYVKGTVNGNVLGAYDKIEITGNINKDLRVEVKDISVQNDKNVLGSLYIETVGQNDKVETLKSIYPNLINKVVEVNKDKMVGKKFNILNLLFSTIATVLLSWGIYLLINKFSKTKIFESNLQKVIKYKTPVILVGTLSFVAIPIVLIVVMLLLAFGVYIVAVPIITIYAAIIIIGLSTNVFIIGSLVSTFILKKVSTKEKGYLKNLIPLGTFLVISLIPNIPFISGIVGILYAMATVGIVTVCLFKKSEKI